MSAQEQLSFCNLCFCNCTSASVPTSAPAIGILPQEEILKLYSDVVPEMPKCKKRTQYYTSYKTRVQESETYDQSVKR